MQLIRKMPGFFRRLNYAALQCLKQAWRMLGRWRTCREPANVDGQGSKLLADLIVQFARYSAPLLLLSRQEFSRQSPNLIYMDLRDLFQLSSFGNIAPNYECRF